MKLFTADADGIVFKGIFESIQDFRLHIQEYLNILNREEDFEQTVLIKDDKVLLVYDNYIDDEQNYLAYVLDVSTFELEKNKLYVGH